MIKWRKMPVHAQVTTLICLEITDLDVVALLRMINSFIDQNIYMPSSRPSSQGSIIILVLMIIACCIVGEEIDLANSASVKSWSDKWIQVYQISWRESYIELSFRQFHVDGSIVWLWRPTASSLHGDSMSLDNLASEILLIALSLNRLSLCLNTRLHRYLQVNYILLQSQIKESYLHGVIILIVG